MGAVAEDEPGEDVGCVIGAIDLIVGEAARLDLFLAATDP